jgi:hypothetical protein
VLAFLFSSGQDGAGGESMRFKKGDLLTTKNNQAKVPVAQVLRVTREGVIHCVNLVECDTMKEGAVFQLTADQSTGYEWHSRK